MSGRAAETPGTAKAVPGALTLGELYALARGFPRPKVYELRCNPLVLTWMRISAAETSPAFLGTIGSLCGIPVTEKPELGLGCWELYEDGEMIKSGRLTA